MYATPHLSQPQISHSSVPPSHEYQSHMNHQTSSIPQNAYHSPLVLTQPMTEFPQLDSGVTVHVFSHGDDPIACLNKAMAFLSAVAALRFSSTNNQLRTSSNLRNQTTIQDGRVTVQQEGRNAAWFKEKAMLAEAQESGQILDEEQLAFLADPGIPDGQAAQTTIPNSASFQTKDLDTYDYDCDDVSTAQAVLMANLSDYGSDVISEVNIWESSNQEKNNEPLTAELERYKERVKTFEQRLNIDLSTREKMIDSQMDDMIKGKLALNVISCQHAVIPVIDDEETLILEEVSRSKMLAKQNNPISKEKKINTTPINYVELNRLSEDFGKRFVPQQELSDEQAFWLQTSHPNTDQSDISPVKIKAPRELPKVSLVNTRFKKLKYHLGQFDTVVKKSITPDAITEREWGFEHTKAVFLNEIIPFLKTLKDIFNVFDKDLLNEDKFCNNQNALEIPEYFNNNDLKAQLQAKDTTIRKLKEHIKSMSENDKDEKVKHDMDEINTINIELEHSMAKLLSENELFHKEIEHLKKIYKDQFDSIKKTHALSKEHCDSLIA
ncbi:hypothetical protein Tco_1380045 [Tanacetum coccineum]